jgi:regulator of protease activity HflC (stomatin/prohibitin superfamily)
MNTWIPCSVSVPDGYVAIAEQFGRFYKLLTPGLNFLPPWCSVKDLSDWGKRAAKDHCMRLTQQIETNPRKCMSKYDDIPLHINLIVRYAIIQPILAAYQVDVLPEAIRDVCAKALREKVSVLEDKRLGSKRVQQAICENVMNDVAAKVNQWGVRLLGIEVDDLHEAQTSNGRRTCCDRWPIL